MKKAITLIEILVVLAIIALMISISVPIFYSFGSSFKLNTSAKEILTVLRTARSYAISRNDTYSVDFDPALGVFAITYQSNILDKQYKLPENIKIIQPAAQDQYDFYASGSAEGATITVKEVKDGIGEKSKNIVITPTTGRIRIE